MAACCDGGEMVACIVVDPYIRGALWRTSLVVGRPARRTAFTRVGQACNGVMLLGTAQTISEMKLKVQSTLSEVQST
jgi:hypothetical protein